MEAGHQNVSLETRVHVLYSLRVSTTIKVSGSALNVHDHDWMLLVSWHPHSWEPVTVKQNEAADAKQNISIALAELTVKISQIRKGYCHGYVINQTCL